MSRNFNSIMATRVTSVILRRFGVVSKLTSSVPINASFPKKIVQSRQYLELNLSFSKSISTSAIRLKDESDSQVENENDEDLDEQQEKKDDWMANYTGDPKDRTRKISLERSIAYLESDAYRQTYGNQRVIILFFSESHMPCPFTTHKMFCVGTKCFVPVQNVLC